MIASRYKKVYYSDIQGLPIKDAITGEMFPWKVGSKDEQRFFKVIDNSLLNTFDSQYQNGHTMFFKNAEDYMEFNNIVLDDYIIEKFNERKNKVVNDSIQDD
tara:strand:+ start:145 stop:450 length:306 start_codon:yes stop_codon:yes gene_type:complete